METGRGAGRVVWWGFSSRKEYTRNVCVTIRVRVAALNQSPRRRASGRSRQAAGSRIARRSCAGVVMGMRLNFSTRIFATAGVMNAGRVGPSRMFRIPK
jgi:hypothetical protein